MMTTYQFHRYNDVWQSDSVADDGLNRRSHLSVSLYYYYYDLLRRPYSLLAGGKSSNPLSNYERTRRCYALVNRWQMTTTSLENFLPAVEAVLFHSQTIRYSFRSCSKNNVFVCKKKKYHAHTPTQQAT